MESIGIIWIHPIIELSSISLSSAALAAFHQQWDEWHRPAAERDLCTLAVQPHSVHHIALCKPRRWPRSSKMVQDGSAMSSHVKPCQAMSSQVKSLIQRRCCQKQGRSSLHPKSCQKSKVLRPVVTSRDGHGKRTKAPWTAPPYPWEWKKLISFV